MKINGHLGGFWGTLFSDLLGVFLILIVVVAFVLVIVVACYRQTLE